MAEPVAVRCPKCGAKWTTNTDASGTVQSCPGCGGPVTVPRRQGIPTAPKDRCPGCGSAAAVPLGDKAIERLYADYGAKKPPMLYRPRKCEACGCRWEVIPPRSALLAGVGGAIAGALACAALAVFCWLGGADGDDRFQTFAWILLVGAAACGYTAWHFFRKLNTTPAAADPDD
jgi:hypothetical protein